MNFAREAYLLGDKFICLTSGEGEGFIVYSKRDGKIYDVSITDFPKLDADQMTPRWNSFFELIEWYLGDRNDR